MDHSEGSCSLRNQAISYLTPGHAAETLSAGAGRRLAGALERESDPGWARSVLFKRFQAGVPVGCVRRYRQLIARSIYKDPELRRLDALYQALKFLNDQSAVAHTPEPSSLVAREQHSLVGAINKRIWELTGDPADLRRSRNSYGAAADIQKTGDGMADKGLGCGDCERLCWLGDEGPHYPLINKAFVMDRLAGESATEADLESVNAVRNEVIKLTEREASTDRWSWPRASAIEARVGRSDSDGALSLLRGLSRADVANWQQETTASQLAAILELRMDRGGRTALGDADVEVMRRLLSWPDEVPQDEIVRYVLRSGDRMGLALSGGGFRASLFHLGVLAALAEFDVLRDLEAISCVSGGSIAGAAYYLKLKTLTEEKPDEEIGPEDCVNVVKETLKSFTDVVTTKNLRNRAFFHPLGLLRIVSGENVSDRIARLYDSLLYAAPDSDGDATLLCETKIQPFGERSGFNPRQQNWRRATKVPVLLLNATSTNTGYVWQFTSTWMGETPSAVAESIDAVDLVERIYLDGNKPEHRITLGQAVAASAAVPGLFPPIPLRGIVEGRLLRLVDGGVADNQGMVGLRENECTSIIVSDASGQHSHQERPSRLRTRSLLRCGSLGRASLRRANLSALRTDAGWPSRYWLVHLTKGLEPGMRGARTDEPVEYAAVTGTGIHVQSVGDGFRGALDQPATQNGLPRRVQAKLAGLRTDLDKFSLTEANTLMYSGYVQTIAALSERKTAAGSDRVVDNTWSFLSVAKQVAAPGESNESYRKLVAELDCGQHLFLRRTRKLWPQTSKRFKV